MSSRWRVKRVQITNWEVANDAPPILDFIWYCLLYRAVSIQTGVNLL